MFKKFIIGIVTAGSVMLGSVGLYCAVDKAAKTELYKQVELFSYALTTVWSDYVEPPNPKDLIYGALKGMLASLDMHSQFLDPDTYKELKVETEGQFGGLGIEITLKDGLITIITPIEDTPAWKAGIKAGDRIVKIDDKVARDFTLSDAVKLLRGKPGSAVNVVVLREQEGKLYEFKITRELIKIQDVKDVKILEDNIGYIRLTVFQESTPQDLVAALDKLKKQGADSLILDLRNNPGGLLDIAVKATEKFLPEGKTVVSTKGRDGQQTMVFKSRKTDAVYSEWPMIVLINIGSASGSEILAGALQDNKRAIVLGTKSFGKGSVQTVIPLPDGSALRLTTSKYLTPSGRSIQNEGIMPDVVVEEAEAREAQDKEKGLDLEEVFEQVEKKIPLEPLEKEDKSYKTDAQIMRAVDLLKGIKIYRRQLGK
ncbi:MAG: S41 family peptidase [Candidatus Omnitrophota bacterium]